MPNVVAFTDATAMATFTTTAVPGLLTRVTARSYEEIHGERSVVDAFAEAGYTTWWLSNQKRLGHHDTLATALASRADEITFVNLNYHSKHQLDGRLLAPFQKALGADADRKFIVVHLRGSHWNYSRRHPDAFDVFRPSLNPDRDYQVGDASIRTETINSYDNSILYTDTILAEIIGMLAADGGHASLTYTSDHGENLLDDDRNHFAHGSVTPYTVEVPLLVWLSDSYAARFPEVEAALIANRDARVSHDDVFFTLLDLARIRHRFEDERMTLSRASFEERDRYVLGPSMKATRYAGGRVDQAMNR